MNPRYILALLVATFLSATLVSAETVPATPRVASTGGKSPHETTSAKIGGYRVVITYGRPYTKDPKSGQPRIIWGSLVKWDKADRLGSDEATTLLTEQPLVVGHTELPAGAYTLYIVPSETGVSKLVFSSHLGEWGVPVDETKDVARFDLVKSALPASVDQLTLAVEADAATGGGVLKIQWETTQFSLPFSIKK
jgi:hypothetical protein